MKTAKQGAFNIVRRAVTKHELFVALKRIVFSRKQQITMSVKSHDARFLRAHDIEPVLPLIVELIAGRWT